MQSAGMRHSLVPLTIAFAALAGSALAAEPPACPPRSGKPGAPLVSRPETARAIFLAVEADVFPQADRAGFPAVDVNDDGKHWTVYRWRPPQPLPNGEMRLTAGGGQLSLTVDKCTGEVADLRWQR